MKVKKFTTRSGCSMSISSSEQSIYDQEYYTYHLELLSAFSAQIQLLPPFDNNPASDEDQEFLAALAQLQQQPQGIDFLEQGQTLMCRVVGAYSHLMPLLYRDLLWFFGGDCLHYMPDEEIAIFQLLDEQREDAKQLQAPFSYQEARAKLLGMH
jgi:hypothetical protein